MPPEQTQTKPGTAVGTMYEIGLRGWTDDFYIGCFVFHTNLVLISTGWKELVYA